MAARRRRTSIRIRGCHAAAATTCTALRVTGGTAKQHSVLVARRQERQPLRQRQETSGDLAMAARRRRTSTLVAAAEQPPLRVQRRLRASARQWRRSGSGGGAVRRAVPCASRHLRALALSVSAVSVLFSPSPGLFSSFFGWCLARERMTGVRRRAPVGPRRLSRRPRERPWGESR